jgi:hypothetical protein
LAVEQKHRACRAEPRARDEGVHQIASQSGRARASRARNRSSGSIRDHLPPSPARSTVSTETNGHFTLTGDFSDAQPIMQLTDTAGNMYAIACDVEDDMADCDTADVLGLHPRTYKLAFGESCTSDTDNPGIPDLADSLPTMVTVN